jgi:hypothetical protein
VVEKIEVVVAVAVVVVVAVRIDRLASFWAVVRAVAKLAVADVAQTSRSVNLSCRAAERYYCETRRAKVCQRRCYFSTIDLKSVGSNFELMGSEAAVAEPVLMTMGSSPEGSTVDASERPS